MTNSCFLSHPSRANGRFGKLIHLRALLAFALVVFFSCLPLYALAQTDGVTLTNKSYPYINFVDGGAFVVYQGSNGDTICRDATIDETRALRTGSNDHELHQINHLKDESLASGSNTIESATGLTIVLRATQQLEGNPAAKAAFIAAAAKWEALIKDPITIVIDVDFGTTFFGQAFSDSSVLGATSTQELYFDGNYTDIRNRLNNHASPGTPEAALASALPANSLPTDIGSANTVLVASPLLRALGALPADATTDTTTPGAAPQIAFNSAYNFDFDPSDGITLNRTDFDAVAVHEMGHALGFDSEVGARELDPNQPLLVSMWDLFRFRPGTANLNNFTTAQRILSSGGTQIQFIGGPELGLSTGRPDGTGGDLNQASHWKDDLGIDANYIGIMDPNIRRNKREVMTVNDQEAIDSFGYTLTPSASPPNDDFSSAIILSGASGTVTGTNAGATKEAGEPIEPQTSPPRTGGRSVWYNWTATGTGQATFDTNGSTFDTTLAVYTGTAVNALTLIVANDDISNIGDPEPRNIQSLVTFNATAGTTYRIQLDGFNGTDFGSIILHWSGPAGPPPTAQFTITAATVDESAGAAVIAVSRTGDSSSSVSVGYFTSDGSATVFNQDYSPTSGRLDFASGDAVKSIIVPINNDTFAESNETFSVTLNNPSNGVTIGTPSSVVITIADDDTFSPNTVQFSASSQSVAETPDQTTRVNLTVTRTGNLSGPASIDYASADGSASERSDYLAALGTLHFAAGESSKTISVFIVDDRYGEGPETFNLSLSNPVGCTLGSQTSFTVTINSDELVNGLNPVKDASFNTDFFVREQYIDFLNREADPSGLAFWKDQIDQCTTQQCREVRRINVSAAFFVSIEFQETGYLVYKTYEAAFDSGEHLKLRDFLPDTQEIGRGVVIGQPGADAQLEANKQKFFKAFVQRPTFLQSYPLTLTAFDFVNKLNASTYDPLSPGSGALTPSQRNAVVSQMSFNPASPDLRAQALRTISENSLFSSRQSNKAFVLMQYFGYLRRNPNDAPEPGLDFAGYNFWLTKLNQFNGNYINAEMVKAFITSGEYQLRFGP